MDAFDRAVELARAHVRGAGAAPVATDVDPADLHAALGGALPDDGLDPEATIRLLHRGVDGAIVASSGPRYFGFVTGGSHPAALAADVLTSAWDQNTAFAVMSPGAAVVEEIAGAWLMELLGLPVGASVGFVTGAQMANVTCLLAARTHAFAEVGWDDVADGLVGAPPIRVIVGAEAHVTVHAALRFIGLGAPTSVVPTDEQGRMRPDLLAEELLGDDAPAIVCAQAGNVNTGACDDMAAIADACDGSRAWLHVDGAFGLWAAAAPGRRHLVAGVERADSWATDGHKWLNVPYDCGVAFTTHPSEHRRAMALSAAYLSPATTLRDGSDWAPEASRRARGFAVWAALRSLGRTGVAELVERNCRLAAHMAAHLATAPGVRVLNDVVLNQALVDFDVPGRDPDEVTDAVIAQVQADGVCWAGGTTWNGRRAMRLSVSNWSTTMADANRSVEAILAAFDQVRHR